jgi:2-polyprenyl-6-methoxyphenol hydroxylase-like FAD-dependent oxidoreductase
MTEHAVVVAGGGPTELMLAGELALAGVDVVIVERRAGQDVDGSRGGGLHSRTIEVLDQRGIAERFLSAGQVMQVQGYAHIPLDISDFPTRHNYGLALWQSQFEPILADWVGELGVPILPGREVVGFAQDDTGVDVAVSGDTSIRAEYLVGCDGGRSLIRKAAGIDFPGLDPSTSWMIAEVEMDEEPEFGFRRDSVGQHALGRRAEGEPIRVVLTERHVDHTGDPSMDELRKALGAVYGTDYGLRSANWISRFTDMTRQAASYRQGRVLLAGDAAHVHPPQGRPGPQHRRAGCREPGLEAGPGGRRDITGEPPGHLPRRTASRRGPGAAQHHGASRAQHPGRPPPGPSRHHGRTAGHGRAAPAVRRDALRSRHPLRPARDTRCSGAACPIWTSLPPTARRECSPSSTTPEGSC